MEWVSASLTLRLFEAIFWLRATTLIKIAKLLLVYFSFIFEDISPGLLAIPFWIPRISMSIGVTIFLIALIDDFFTVWKKEQPSYVKNADPILKDNT